MLIPSILLAAAFCTISAVALPSPNFTSAHQREPCGTVTTDNDIFRTNEAFERIKNARQISPARRYNFDVYWHVVSANFSYSGGWIPDSQITAQMELLNTHYEGTGISFTHVNTTRVLSRYWHEVVDSDSSQTPLMQQLFRRGGSEAMNVYTVGFYRDKINGFSTLPVNYATRPSRDGVVLLFDLLPGGSNIERQGSTLTHEAGHWLGLRHTFVNGCEGAGDGVDDTPAEASAAYGCPVDRDTCPGGGLDPVNNFMDYSDESCRNEFTTGQVSLMHRSIEIFRV